MQKGLKRFLKHRLGRSTNMRRDIDENINAYMDFYNNATTVSTTRSVPAERYHGFIHERDTMGSFMKDGTLGWLKCLN